MKCKTIIELVKRQIFYLEQSWGYNTEKYVKQLKAELEYLEKKE